MSGDRVSATAIIDAPAEVIFDALASPASHAAIDGTGWVRASRESQPLTAVGQIFRMIMYHPGHPDGEYQMANRVEVLERPCAIAWMPGQEAGDGTITFPGWLWRYDLVATASSSTEVTLTYDWSAVSEELRRRHSFPMFPPDHLSNSLANLAEVLAGG